MIYTITPNPALDLGGMVKNLRPNEKAYVLEETRFPGGNALNAARIIHRMGVPVQATGFLGGGIGQEIKSLLAQEGVPQSFIQIKESTRVNVTISNRETRLQTRLSFHGPQIARSEEKKLFEYIDHLEPHSLLLIGGSLPPGLSKTFLSQVIKRAKKRQIPTVVDVPGPLLDAAVQQSPILIKPNLIEFQEWTRRKVQSISKIIPVAQGLTSKVPLICVSSVEDGALLISSKSVHFGRIPKIRIRSTVGAGDSMVGAMCVRLSLHRLPPTEHSPELCKEILQYGLAAACATLSTPGTHLGETKEILRFLPQIIIKQIK